MNIDVKQIDPFILPSVRFEQRDDLPAVRGIYFVIAESEILYIGRSVNIQQRWQSHHRTKQIEAYNGVILAWFSADGLGKRDLEGLEEACIEFFSPLLNDLTVPRELYNRRNKQKHAYHTLGFDPSEEVYQALLRDARRIGISVADLIPVRVADSYMGRHD